MLSDAVARHYAVPMFDVSDLEMIRAAAEEAEALRSPVILAALAPDIAGTRLNYWFALASLAARNVSVPVCIHLDHASDFAQVKRAAEIGFTSVMLDASAENFEVNMRRSREVTEAMHPRGITVEAELGHVGNGLVGSGEKTSSESENADNLTQPEKVAEFVDCTHVDALAVAIGTAHGVYVRTPKLDIARLDRIRHSSPVPLVLHGGSGTPADQLDAAIRHGISKINIFSELLNAWNTGMFRELQKQSSMSVWPSVLRVNPEAALRSVIRGKITQFGSAGRA